MPGRLRVDLSFSATALHSEHDVDENQFEPDVAPEAQAHTHALDFALIDLDLVGVVGLSERLGVEVGLPLRLNRGRAVFVGADGGALPQFESIHHRNETLMGAGDLSLGARVAVLRPQGAQGWLLDISAGLSLPTGNTQPNPFDLGRQGEPHQHVFFGTGTIDPRLSAQAVYAAETFRLSGWMSGSTALVDNSHGFRASSRVAGGLGGQSSLGLDRFNFSAAAEAQHETPATWEGERAENSGRTDLFASFAAFWDASERWKVFSSFKLPFFTHAKGGQLDTPFIVGLGLSYVVDLLPAPHDHVHGHAEHEQTEHEPVTAQQAHARVQASSGDIADIAEGGQSFALSDALVAGKVTVVDFWAEWCQPCHAITVALAQLAEQHSQLAVRRAEVPDFDTPVAQEHLAGAPGLPVVWVFDASGEQVATLVATDASEVERVVLELLSP